MRRYVPFIIGVGAFLLAGNVFGQAIVSAHSGAIHHVEGRASIDDQVVTTRFAVFPNLNPGGVLRTERGRVEMLLTPGVILRMGEDSSVRMVSNELSDTRLDVLGGSVLVEVMDLLKDNSVTLFHNGASIQPLRSGLYRVDSDSACVRVYDGKARVVRRDDEIIAKKGREVTLGELLVAAKFDPKVGDSLYRWGSRRSSYLAAANIPAARSLDERSRSWGSSGWLWNPYFGMFTYVPAGGSLNSPFGWTYWSPRTVLYVYRSQRAFANAGNGMSGMGSGAGANAGRPVYSPAPSRGAMGSSAGGPGGSNSSLGGRSAPRTSAGTSGPSSPRATAGGRRR